MAWFPGVKRRKPKHVFGKAIALALAASPTVAMAQTIPSSQYPASQYPASQTQTTPAPQSPQQPPVSQYPPSRPASAPNAGSNSFAPQGAPNAPPPAYPPSNYPPSSYQPAFGPGSVPATAPAAQPPAGAPQNPVQPVWAQDDAAPRRPPVDSSPYGPSSAYPPNTAPATSSAPNGRAPISVAQNPNAPRPTPISASGQNGGGATQNIPLGVGVVPPARPEARNAQPSAPFQLTDQEAAHLDQLLTIWETESGKIKSYRCSFERWEYDRVFGPGPDMPKTKSSGMLTYMKPDKGSFRVDEIGHYTPPATSGEQPTWTPKDNDAGEHWVCDGKAVYEYNTPRKQLIVRELPPEMQGKAIADGPLPFLFGAEKDKLKSRYFLRHSRTSENEVWFEAYPRWSGDAANFSRVELILDKQKFLPKYLKVYLPNNNSTFYKFGDPSVNSAVDLLLPKFQSPMTPLGWQKVVEPAQGTQTPDVVPPQAQRPAQGIMRR